MTTATDQKEQTATVCGQHLTMLHNEEPFAWATYATLQNKAVVVNFEYTHEREFEPYGRNMMEDLIEEDMMKINGGQCDGVLWLDNANIWE